MFTAANTELSVKSAELMRMTKNSAARRANVQPDREQPPSAVLCHEAGVG